LATLAVGYADGYSRRLGNRGRALVGGRRCPVAGRVTMNLTVVDLGPDGHALPGDEAVLLGTQGGESIRAHELAAWADTIGYEILTSIRTPDRRQKD
jgi:alanine racemase